MLFLLVFVCWFFERNPTKKCLAETEWCARNKLLNLYIMFEVIYVRLFVYLVTRGVLSLVDEIRRNRNDRHGYSSIITECSRPDVTVPVDWA